MLPASNRSRREDAVSVTYLRMVQTDYTVIVVKHRFKI